MPSSRLALPEVQLRFSPDGTPLAIRHDGQIWMVDPDVHTGDAELRTFTLRREPLAEAWQLESVT